jgi:hypothetical protein
VGARGEGVDERRGLRAALRSLALPRLGPRALGPAAAPPPPPPQVQIALQHLEWPKGLPSPQILALNKKLGAGGFGGGGGGPPGPLGSVAAAGAGPLALRTLSASTNNGDAGAAGGGAPFWAPPPASALLSPSPSGNDADRRGSLDGGGKRSSGSGGAGGGRGVSVSSFGSGFGPRALLANLRGRASGAALSDSTDGMTPGGEEGGGQR